jgi:hypothetical protein
MEHLAPRARRGSRANIEDLLADMAVTTAIAALDNADPAELREFLELADHLMIGGEPAPARRAA